MQWGIKAAFTYTWTYPLPLDVVYYADMMGYREDSAGNEYGWIRSISLIAFETYIIDESAICFCVGIAQQWGKKDGNNARWYYPIIFKTLFYAQVAGDREEVDAASATKVSMVTFAGNEFLSFYTDYVGGTNRFIVIGVQQWGTIVVYANLQKYTFVIPFNETCFYCGGIPWKTASAGYCGVAYTVSKIEFEMYYYRANSAIDVCWIAIGV